MYQTLDAEAALAALDWQIALGADEAISDTQVNRFETVAPKPVVDPPVASSQAIVAKKEKAEAEWLDSHAVVAAEQMAAAAADLAGLRAALAAYEFCDLKKGARNLVFADGNPAARVMVIGEAPGRDEDREGLPFVGRAGQLLDRMFAAISLDRRGETPDQSLYIANVLPWRPPQNRDPNPEEVAMMMPFLRRHIALANPDFLVLMGNIACLALLGERGITRLRGNWAEVAGKPVLPMFHPAYLLRSPEKKREAWADLQSIKARLIS